MQQETVNELVALIGSVITGIIRTDDKISSMKLIRQEQAMGEFLRGASKLYKGDPGVEPVVSALMKRQDRKAAKEPIEQSDLTDEQIMAKLSTLDDMLSEEEKNFKPFLFNLAEQVVKASASGGFLGIGRRSNAPEMAFLNKMRQAMNMPSEA
jgi:hypothetical protein